MWTGLGWTKIYSVPRSILLSLNLPINCEYVQVSYQFVFTVYDFYILYKCFKYTRVSSSRDCYVADTDTLWSLLLNTIIEPVHGASGLINDVLTHYCGTVTNIRSDNLNIFLQGNNWIYKRSSSVMVTSKNNEIIF